MHKRFASVISWIAALLLLAPVGRVRAEENGIKIGDGRLHPFFDLEDRFDTAAQLGVDSQGNAKGNPDMVIHFRPGLKLEVPSPILSVDLNGMVEYLFYTGITSKSARDLNRFQAEGNLELGILKGSTVSFEVGDHFTRSDQTANVGLTFGVLSFYNDARVVATISPGGGSLSISPGYHLTLENFSPLLNGVAPYPVGNLNYLNHRITLENRWRFLPKTAVLLDAEYGFRTYTNNSPVVSNTNIQYFKASTGVAGLITPHISATGRIGFGMDVTTQSFASVIGQLEGAYLPNETSSVRLGVIRNFEPTSFPYASYEDDRAYLSGRVLLFSRLTFHGLFSVDYLPFKGGTGPARNDTVFGFDAGLDVELMRWLILSAGDSLTSRSSPTLNSTAALNFTADQVYLRLTFIY